MVKLLYVVHTMPACRFEMQRMYWNGKLGNLVLLPLAMPGLSTITNADYDAKAAHYRLAR
jgi:hypothetical protein